MNWELPVSGLLLGIYAGMAPGPTMTMVIVQSLKHGEREGLKVAIAPLLTDAPIVLLSVGLLSALERSGRVLAAISVVGAGILAGFALDCFRAPRPKTDIDEDGAPRRSILKGVVANALNPHPYLTWMTVAGPLLIQAWQLGVDHAIVFLVCMYAPMIGLKSAVALSVGAGRGFLLGAVYPWAMRGLGLVLTLFAVRFVLRAVELWGAS